MNEKQKRILVSLVAGSALSLALGLTAHAEDTDLQPTPASQVRCRLQAALRILHNHNSS